MTYKQPDGLDPRSYKNRVSGPVSRSYTRRSEASQRAARERRTGPKQVKALRGAQAGSVVETARRIVTMPHEAVQPLTWAERHERYRGQQVSASTRGRLVPRTLAQTGRPARQAVPARPLKTLPRQHSSARLSSRIPVRSGKLRGNGAFWRRLWGLLFGLILIGGGIGFALLGPFFRVQRIVISGTQNQRLIASIQGLGIQGQDIFLLDQATLLTRMETLPLVANANMDVQLPGTIAVSVQERVPVLLWQAGKQTFGLGQDGTVIAPQTELRGTEHLAVVVDTRRGASQVRPGNHFNAADMVFVEQIFEQVPGIEGVAPFSLQYTDTLMSGGHAVPANLAGSGSYVLISANGWRAYLGDSQNSTSLANRLVDLQQILSMVGQGKKQLATIDLRFGLRPTYTLKA